MKLWSEVSPSIISSSRARARSCVCVCIRGSLSEGGNDLPVFPAAAVTPAGHAGAEEALRWQMLAQTRLHAMKVCMPAHASPSFTQQFLWPSLP